VLNVNGIEPRGQFHQRSTRSFYVRKLHNCNLLEDVNVIPRLNRTELPENCVFEGVAVGARTSDVGGDDDKVLNSISVITQLLPKKLDHSMNE
jgi:hypothetical protein